MPEAANADASWWTGALDRSRRVVATTLLTAAALTATTAGGAEMADHTYTAQALATGAEVYVENCALCHGPDGTWVPDVNLARGEFPTVVTDADLRRVITQGAAGGRMPAFNLNPERLDGIIAFMRTGFDPDGEPVKLGDAGRGAAVFTGAGGCNACHRVNGVGPYTAPDLSNVARRRTPAALQRSIRQPETALLPINRAVTILTRDEELIQGRRLNEDTFTVQVIDAKGKLRSLEKADLVRFELAQSPTHRPTRLSEDEVADLVAYLLTLRR